MQELKLKSGDVYYNKETNKHYLIPFMFDSSKRWVLEVETGAVVIYTILHDCVKLKVTENRKYIKSSKNLQPCTVVRAIDGSVYFVVTDTAGDEFILTNVKNGEQYSVPEHLDYQIDEFEHWFQLAVCELLDGEEPMEPTEFKEFDHVIIGSSTCDDLDDVAGVIIEVSDDPKFKYLVETKGVKIWCADNPSHCGCCCDSSGKQDDRVNCFFIRSKIEN